MKTRGLTTQWTKSSRSSGSGGQCVEARTAASDVHIRDSKQGEDGPILNVHADAWTLFLGAVVSGKVRVEATS
jgi:hypothetical protein